MVSSILLILRNILRSSANRRKFEKDMTSPISLMNIEKRSGPKMDPCGTPEKTENCAE